MSIISSIIINKLGRLKFNLVKNIKKESFQYNEEVQEIVYQIREEGYAIIPNFYSAEECEILRKEIDDLILKYNDIVWKDKVNADKRLFGAEGVSELIEQYYNNDFLLNVAENYFQAKMNVATTLAAKMDYVLNNPGSGGGWHRDANFFQFKAITYLSDVNEKNGPFQYIEKSHLPKQIIKDTIRMGKKALDVRMSEEEIQKILDKEPYRYKLFTAPAGTLIFADTSGLHTGKSIEEGSRYTLFNYYYPSYTDIEERKKYFKNAYKESYV